MPLTYILFLELARKVLPFKCIEMPFSGADTSPVPIESSSDFTIRRYFENSCRQGEVGAQQ